VFATETTRQRNGISPRQIGQDEQRHSLPFMTHAEAVPQVPMNGCRVEKLSCGRQPIICP
jgi:hypothetical protein